MKKIDELKKIFDVYADVLEVEELADEDNGQWRYIVYFYPIRVSGCDDYGFHETFLDFSKDQEEAMDLLEKLSDSCDIKDDYDYDGEHDHLFRVYEGIIKE